jgi:phospholipase C
VFPNCPDKLFQFHHQSFNYYASFAPGTAARASPLRDEEEFLQLAGSSAKACNLKPVSFIKPVGAENEHPGYASESAGSNHLIQLLQAIQGSRCAKDTMVVVTYDEFGGQWDHVTPPGQGGNFVVDHTQYDTTSIVATIERRFDLAPLSTRDAAVHDLSNVFHAKQSAR